MATALGAILRDERARQQPCGVFGSFGWSGEAIDELDKRLRVLAALDFPRLMILAYAARADVAESRSLLRNKLLEDQ